MDTCCQVCPTTWPSVRLSVRPSVLPVICLNTRPTDWPTRWMPAPPAYWQWAQDGYQQSQVFGVHGKMYENIETMVLAMRLVFVVFWCFWQWRFYTPTLFCQHIILITSPVDHGNIIHNLLQGTWTCTTLNTTCILLGAGSAFIGPSVYKL